MTEAEFHSDMNQWIREQLKTRQRTSDETPTPKPPVFTQSSVQFTTSPFPQRAIVDEVIPPLPRGEEVTCPPEGAPTHIVMHVELSGTISVCEETEEIGISGEDEASGDLTPWGENGDMPPRCVSVTNEQSMFLFFECPDPCTGGFTTPIDPHLIIEVTLSVQSGAWRLDMAASQTAHPDTICGADEPEFTLSGDLGGDPIGVWTFTVTDGGLTWDITVTIT